jgi:hypothetical protein
MPAMSSNFGGRFFATSSEVNSKLDAQSCPLIAFCESTEALAAVRSGAGTIVSVARFQPGGGFSEMRKLALIAVLLLAASPVAAQSRQQALGAGGQTNNSSLTNTGVICEEEMTATFCNTATSPNNGGYGSGAGAASTSAGISTPSPAIPPCPELGPADELCN